VDDRSSAQAKAALERMLALPLQTAALAA